MKGLFNKFFPESSNEQQQEFANSLPEFKINMAKLQGHFLKYRDSPAQAIANGRSLLDIEYQIKDMSINEWLRRLNMHQFAGKFRKDGVKRVSDLKYVGEGELTVWGIEALTDRKRVMGMIQGDETAKSLFALQSRSQARTIIAHFLPPVQGDSGSSGPSGNGLDMIKEMDEILDIIGDEQITGYQLRDIFDENKNISVVKKKLLHKVTQNMAIQKGLAKDLVAEKEVEDPAAAKDKKKEVPSENIEGLLKSLGLGESIPKLKEHEIAEPEVFYELSDDKIIELLEIKTEGKKMRFKDRLKEVKDKHEKALAKKAAAEDVSEIVAETFEKLQKQSTISF
jgi:SAM domain (Sterile alpha motif)